ncbi:hypothetical protein [Micromonospora lupini]|uniref:Vegetative cell wall protein gp1 n=1 Tax=Micromonospora lupini str. Lupac 08 TaxID=1150864 RepID=I0L1Y4_9ACTN|nr:hypothetical protein [Micromonospora lupini]CCH17831.1 conserved hypothetical protein [Micromonospora lupini str. Lupac 08]
MTDLIATLGKKITERWLATVLLPGLLYVAITGWALLAGHGHALDLSWLIRRLNDLWQHHPPGPAAAAVATAVALAGAGLAGVAATVVAEDVVHRLWIIRGPQARLDTLAKRTEARWEGRVPRPPQRYLPQRATVIGERFRLIGERVHAQYGLSVNLAWPRLWILASADTRTMIGAAHRQYFSDAALAAWALLYLPWTVRWWPAVLIATAVLAFGYRQARTSSAILATLIEATVDAHANDLAKVTGIDLPEGRLTPEEGNKINDILAKRA